MALYIGSSQKLKLRLSNTACHLIIPSAMPALSGLMLLASDGHILKDSNGLYLTVKGDE